MTHQCKSCGGFCKKSGCERENVQAAQAQAAPVFGGPKAREQMLAERTAQTPDCGCIGPMDCTGECCEKTADPEDMRMYNDIQQTAVEPVAWVGEISEGSQLMFFDEKPDWNAIPLYTSPPDHTKAMRLALEALNNSVDLVWDEYTEAEHNYGNYPTRHAKPDGMKAMAQQHTAAIAALEKELGE